MPSQSFKCGIVDESVAFGHIFINDHFDKKIICMWNSHIHIKHHTNISFFLKKSAAVTLLNRIFQNARKYHATSMLLARPLIQMRMKNVLSIDKVIYVLSYNFLAHAHAYGVFWGLDPLHFSKFWLLVSSGTTKIKHVFHVKPPSMQTSKTQLLQIFKSESMFQQVKAQQKGQHISRPNTF